MEDNSDLNNIPPFLSGENVYLRGLVSTDATEDYTRWMNDPDVTQFLETGYFPSNVGDLEAYIESVNQDDDTVFLAIVHRDDEDHIGNIKLGPIDWIHRRADIGLVIGEKEYWGQGIATESIRLVVGYAFNRLNLHKLTAGCYANNVGSKKAFEKVGFSKEGIRTDHAHHDGSYVDLVELGLLREAFDS
jgi:RimJ/RimL family protein N-acetyltransferase